MSLANTIKALHGRNNNTGKVFAKDKSDKKTYYKNLSNILTKNEPKAVFEKYNKGNFSNRASEVITTKPNDLANNYHPEVVPKTTVTSGDIPTAKHNIKEVSTKSSNKNNSTLAVTPTTKDSKVENIYKKNTILANSNSLASSNLTNNNIHNTNHTNSNLTNNIHNTSHNSSTNSNSANNSSSSNSTNNSTNSNSTNNQSNTNQSNNNSTNNNSTNSNSTNSNSTNNQSNTNSTNSNSTNNQSNTNQSNTNQSNNNSTNSNSTNNQSNTNSTNNQSNQNTKPIKDLSVTQPIDGAKISPKVITAKPNITNVPSVKDYKLPETKPEINADLFSKNKTLEGSGFIANENTLNRIQATGDFQSKNKPSASPVEPSSKDKFDLSPIAGPIGELVTESKNTPANFKLIHDEQKKQTDLLHKISLKIDKSGGSGGGLLDMAGDLFDRKKGSGLPSKAADLAKRGASKVADLAKRAIPYVKNNLGNIAKGAKSVIGAATNIARTAASSGLASNATLTAGRVLARATPVGLAVTTGAAIGTSIGSKIYEKYQNTDFMKGVGETVAKGAAFFGNKEAQQAVGDTKKYETSAALSEKAKANKANVQKEMEAQGMSKTAQAAVLGNLEVESGFQTKSENTNYSKSSNERIRGIFKTKTKGMSDEELTALKADPVAFGDKMYADTGGHKFRGRGLVQLTGKANYAKYSQQLFNDDRLVKNPDLANDPAIAAKIAVAYTKERAGKVAKKRFGKDLNDLSYDEASNAVTQSVAGEGNDLSKGIHAEFAAKKNAAGKKYLNEKSEPAKLVADSKVSTGDKVKGGDKTSKPVVAKVDAKGKPVDKTTVAKVDAKGKPAVANVEPSKGKPRKVPATDTTGAKIAVSTPSVSTPSVSTPSVSTPSIVASSNEDKNSQSLLPSEKGISIPGSDMLGNTTVATGDVSLVANKDGASVLTNALAVAGKKANISEDLMQRLQSKPVVNNIANLLPSNKSELLANAYVDNSQSSSIPVAQSAPATTNVVRQSAAPAPAPTQSGGRVAASNKQADSKVGKDPDRLAVRNISSTMQRVLDKDFQLGV